MIYLFKFENFKLRLNLNGQIRFHIKKILLMYAMKHVMIKIMTNVKSWEYSNIKRGQLNSVIN